ncbi:MAG: hypothetical protein J6D53_02905, partial [Blautia sp.]|nr:hypothetical protein [Blautia sp.]
LVTGIMNGTLSAFGYSASNISSPGIRAAMPWIFIGVETICYLIIFLALLFMKVEQYSPLDQAAIRLDRDPEAEISEIGEDETLRAFNAMRRENGRAELRSGEAGQG